MPHIYSNADHIETYSEINVHHVLNSLIGLGHSFVSAKQVFYLFFQATKPVQEYLRMPFDAIREQHRIATYLPRPLYVLYMQATAYKDACGKIYSYIIKL